MHSQIFDNFSFATKRVNFLDLMTGWMFHFIVPFLQPLLCGKIVKQQNLQLAHHQLLRIIQIYSANLKLKFEQLLQDLKVVLLQHSYCLLSMFHQLTMQMLKLIAFCFTVVDREVLPSIK
ncbi:hypothetical protein T08_2441 [Trichinella sp. T8]|nr:hypothetical protein T08_2441 [Trichinella sp. T8]